jgi:branched-chain amino acid transport system permease protein
VKAAALFLGGLLLVPALFTRVPLYTMANGVQMAIVAIAPLGLVPLTGYARQISIGQAAFYGTGAYASALLTARAGLSPLLATAVGVAIAAIAAQLIGLLLFRVEGHYLALATIGLGMMCSVAARELDVTGRSEGVAGIPPLVLGDLRTYYVSAGVLFVAVLAVRSLLAARVGRALTAVGETPVAAAACGVDVPARKRLAFVVSAALAALAGSLYAHWVGYVDPSVFGLPVSLQILIVATVGGLRSVWGAPIGAFVIVSLLQLSQVALPRISERAGGQTELVGNGMALVVALLLLPNGLAGIRAGIRRHAPRRRILSQPDVQPFADKPVRLDIDGLRVTFGGVHAVEDLTLSHDRGGVLGLIGPNGAGKTTMLDVLSALTRPENGRVRLDGRRIDGQRPHRLARAGIARTFQTPQPFGALCVLDNVLVSMEAHHRRRSSARLRRRALALLAEVGLAEHADARADELPFGTQRRVELARAIAGQPRLLLLDEPLAGLSRDERNALVAVIRRIAGSGISVLLVEHDVSAVLRASDRVVVLNRGRLLADGTPAEVRTNDRVLAAYLGHHHGED